MAGLPGSWFQDNTIKNDLSPSDEANNPGQNTNTQDQQSPFMFSDLAGDSSSSFQSSFYNPASIVGGGNPYVNSQQPQQVPQRQPSVPPPQSQGFPQNSMQSQFPMSNSAEPSTHSRDSMSLSPGGSMFNIPMQQQQQQQPQKRQIPQQLQGAKPAGPAGMTPQQRAMLLQRLQQQYNQSNNSRSQPSTQFSSSSQSPVMGAGSSYPQPNQQLNVEKKPPTSLSPQEIALLQQRMQQQQQQQNFLNQSFLSEQQQQQQQQQPGGFHQNEGQFKPSNINQMQRQQMPIQQQPQQQPQPQQQQQFASRQGVQPSIPRQTPNPQGGPPRAQGRPLQPEAFLKNLLEFMHKRGTPITTEPLVRNQKVSLYNLFLQVMRMGGSLKVTKTSSWPAVCANMDFDVLNYPEIAAELAQLYARLLGPYEEMVIANFAFQRQQQRKQQQARQQQQQQQQGQGQPQQRGINPNQEQILRGPTSQSIPQQQGRQQSPVPVSQQQQQPQQPQQYYQRRMMSPSSPMQTMMGNNMQQQQQQQQQQPNANQSFAQLSQGRISPNILQYPQSAGANNPLSGPSPTSNPLQMQGTQPPPPQRMRSATPQMQGMGVREPSPAYSQQQQQIQRETSFQPSPDSGVMASHDPNGVQSFQPNASYYQPQPNPRTHKPVLQQEPRRPQIPQQPQPQQQQQQQRVPFAAPIATAPTEPEPQKKLVPDTYVPRKRLVDTYGGYDLRAISSIGAEKETLLPDFPLLNELGTIDIHAITMSLKSMIPGELRVALNTLVELSAEARLPLRLKDCGDLLDSLVYLGYEEIACLLKSHNLSIRDIAASQLSDTETVENTVGSYDKLVEMCEEEADGMTYESAILSDDYEKTVNISRLLSVTTILRNFSFAEDNGYYFSNDPDSEGFILDMVHLLVHKTEAFANNSYKLQAMKDILILLSNMAYDLKLRDQHDAHVMILFLLSFAPVPAPVLKRNAPHQILFQSYVPNKQRYLPAAIDVLAKLLARDPPNRTYIRSLMLSSGQVHNPNAPFDLLTRAFGMTVCTIPRSDVGVIPRAFEARRPILEQALLAACILADFVPPGYVECEQSDGEASTKINVARMWLEGKDGFGPCMLRVALSLAAIVTQPPSMMMGAVAGYETSPFARITQKGMAVLRRLIDKGKSKRIITRSHWEEEEEIDRSKNSEKVDDSNITSAANTSEGTPATHGTDQAQWGDGDKYAIHSHHDEGSIMENLPPGIFPKEDALLGAMLAVQMDSVIVKELCNFTYGDYRIHQDTDDRQKPNGDDMDLDHDRDHSESKPSELIRGNNSEAAVAS